MRDDNYKGPLYKFIEHRYLREFFETGCLVLGTVYSFKDVFEYGIHRGDSDEGRHSIVRTNEGEIVTLRRDVHQPVISEIFRMEAEGEATVEGGTFIVGRTSPDFFVFCTSLVFTVPQFRLWHERENLDACYEISNPAAFLRAVSRVIESSAFFVFAGSVFYTEKEIDFKSPEAALSPAITKRRQDFSWQQECRALWAPRLPGPPLSRWIIKVPEARRYCKPLAHISDGSLVYL